MLAKFFGKDPSKAVHGGGSRSPASNAAQGPTEGSAPASSPGTKGGDRRYDEGGNHQSTSGSSRQLHPAKDAEEILRRLQVGSYSISSISIPQYRVKGSYVEYVVECTQGNTSWRVFRRYQQFKSLDQALRLLGDRGTPEHGDYGMLPLLPGSHWMEVTNQSAKLVGRRRWFLEIYLRQLLVPTNLFYVAHTALYSFLHDGEVPMDTKTVSVQPLLGLATASRWLDDDSPFQSPAEAPLPLMATTERSAEAAEPPLRATEEVPSVPPVEDGAPQPESCADPHASAAPSPAGLSVQQPRGEDSASSGAEHGFSRSGGGSGTPCTRRGTTATATTTTTATPSCRSPTPSPSRSPALRPSDAPVFPSAEPPLTTAQRPMEGTEKEEKEKEAAEGVRRPPHPRTPSQDVCASPSTNSMPEMAEVSAWDSDDAPSEGEWEGSLSAINSSGAPGGDERPPPLAPNCLYCNREFHSALYPHRCYFCRCRYCRNCLWRLRIATGCGSVTPVAESIPSSKGGGGEKPGGVHACLQCTENYKRRWNKFNASASPDPVPFDPRTTQHQQQQQQQRQQRDEDDGLCSCPANAAPAPLCSPSFRPVCPQGSSGGIAPATPSSAVFLDQRAALLQGDSGQPQAKAAESCCGGHSTLSLPVPLSLSLEDFQLLTCLGRGTFGKVIKVVLRATGMVFAMKVMRKSIVYQRYMTSYIKEEKDILVTLPPHPFVVRCHYAFQSDYYLFFVLDYLPGGELYDLIYPVLRITPQEARLYAAELVLAIEHIHAYDVVHRDIKPENIVLDHAGHLKLTDFGLARKNFSQVRRRSFVGSAEYVSPETIQGEYQTPALDWWSLGVLLYEMLAGQAPFHADNNNAVYENVRRMEPDFRGAHVFSPEARLLIQGLLTKDAKTRLQNPVAIRAHPYFAGVDWDALRERRVPMPHVPSIAENDVRHFKREFTSEWASVRPPAQKATRDSIEMLYRCFDNFPTGPNRDTSAAEERRVATGTAPPPINLEEGGDHGGVGLPVPIPVGGKSTPNAGHHHHHHHQHVQPEAREDAEQIPRGSLSHSRKLHHHYLSSIGSNGGRADAHCVASSLHASADFPLRSPSSQVRESLLGVWRLLKVETCALDGRVIYPWGGDVVGVLVYLPTGHYTMQLCPLRRRRLRHKHLSHASKDELCDALSSYVAQFGTFTVPPPPRRPPSCVGEEEEGGGGGKGNGLPRAAAGDSTSSLRSISPTRSDGARGGRGRTEESFDVFEATTSVVWHQVEGHLCPNLSQRLSKMRFDTVAGPPRPALSPPSCLLRRRHRALSDDSGRCSSSSGSSRQVSPRSTNAAAAGGGEDGTAVGRLGSNLSTSTSRGGGRPAGRKHQAGGGWLEGEGEGACDSRGRASAASSRVTLRLVTEPELVVHETFKARTVLTWLRVQSFPVPAPTPEAALGNVSVHSVPISS